VCFNYVRPGLDLTWWALVIGFLAIKCIFLWRNGPLNSVLDIAATPFFSQEAVNTDRRRALSRLRVFVVAF